MPLSSRKTFIKVSLWVFGFFLSGGILHAQTACPPGMVPYGTGTNMSACGYDNSAPPQPPVRWATQWGAIATDGPGGSFGASTNMPSKSEAEQTALADCVSKKGSTTCNIEIAYYNQCAAMVVGDKTHASANASTKDKAIELGKKVCRDDGNTDCRAYYTACSLPKRIQ